MRTFFVLGGCSLAALVGLVAACNGRVERSCFSGAGSSFCDGPQSPPEPPPVGFPPGPGQPFPEQCRNETLTFPGSGDVCTTVDLGASAKAYPEGFVCAAAADCASVCCVVDESGRWLPADEVAGASDAGSDADAEGDAGVDAGRRSVPYTVFACACECLSPRAACALLDHEGGLGGP